ncbi:MAG: hypothetical protein PHV98_06165, partial [Candidatus Omnitrophica bacterium]|nr:hypothetical protein [Candidatus Omnitrophota bacterium]
NILWPKICLGCGREGRYICDKCEVFLSEIELDAPQNLSIVSVWAYEGLIKKIISKIKDEGCYNIAEELIDTIFDKIEFNLPEDAYITYVPMLKKKERARGFNLAELIARKLGAITHRSVIGLLRQQADEHFSIGLKSAGPISNRFIFKKEYGCPENILVVDDYRATGATMKECSEVLKRAGARNVFGFTLAGVF